MTAQGKSLSQEWLCMSPKKIDHDLICEPQHCSLEDCPLKMAESALREAQELADELTGMPNNPEWGFAHNMGSRLKKALGCAVGEDENG